MPQTIRAHYPVPPLSFDENSYRIIARQVQEDFVAIGLLAGLYGVLAVLSAQSIRALTHRRGRRTRPTEIILCLTILALFTSTTIYVVVFTLSYQSGFLRSFITSGRYLWLPTDGTTIDYPVDGPLRLVRDYSQFESCAGTATFTINVTLGDAIVCWRASTVWHRNRAVKLVCGIFVLATIVLGIVATNLGCHPASIAYTEDVYSLAGDPVFLGSLYEGLPIGLATCVLSFFTNLLATLLVGHRAWRLRRHLRGYLVAGSQVEKLLALLVESGAVYCAIWGAVIAFQVSQYRWWNLLPRPASATELRFINIFNVLMNGALVPVIAIYPATIIILVALDRSHIEKGLTQHLESLPTPHVTVMADAITATLHEGGRQEQLPVLVTDEQGLHYGDGEDSKSKEWRPAK